MKNITKKTLAIFVALLMGLSLFSTTFATVSTHATSKAPTAITIIGGDKPQAAILTECAKAEETNGNGAGIKCVVITVVNILSVLVGIVGVIGIMVVGIQYLTAGGNEEQTRKAKRRLFEIIIGIIAYVLVAALLNWLLPNYTPNSNSTSLLPSTLASLTYFGA